MSLSEKANNVNWLMANFVRSTPGVEQAVAVSSDGLLIAMSTQLERGSADKMAAIITGIRALAHGAANELAKGQVMQVLVEMAGAYMFVSAISGGSTLGVVTTRDCDLGLVGFEITLLVERVGTQLTPTLITELKNSLVSIKIFGQLLPERHGDKEFREQFSNVVVNEVNRVDVLVNNLTFFAQPLGLVYEELVLSELIEACLKNLGPEFARKKLAQVIAMGDRSAEEGGPPVVTVKRNFSHKVAKVQGDRIRLTQAIENVMRNAVQAMPNGGRLSINTADVGATEVPDGKLPAGGLVRVEFVDTGEGIALDDLRRVTEPFVTTRNVGVGLGLTIVKKILDRHSGWLELDSMLGRGTTVRFWLPVTMQPHPEDKLLAQLARSGSVSEFFSGETSDEQQNRLAQVLEDQRRRRPPVTGV